ncbi:Nucleoid-associated protein YbaB [Planctomycetes bacterium Pan216]|uniref:Nucleoid-associated protein Pan216_29160 n=1 Tax=Kolteria novifilia TaxID=2527975 RepID=A0A518B4Z7_9BACT|nr:Nucleoid-associated protein YbaB [Planctomycetes bacterium Pan216]
MNLFKMLGNLGNLSKIQEEVQAATQELSKMEFEGKAGADMVIVRVNGAQQMINCTIDPKLVEDNDRELIEDLIVSATNSAIVEAKQKSAEYMQKRLGEQLDMPDLSGILGNLIPKP